MLLSIVVSLTATQTSPILGALGRPAQAWFLSQVAKGNPRLASALHDEDGIKPYTVSTLLDRNGRPIKAGEWLDEGDECWLRVTAIGDDICKSVLETVLKRLPKQLTIHKMDFRVDGYTLNPREHPWAGESSFAEIAQDSQYVKASREVRMEFVSPTAFRTSGSDIALPIPSHVFRSLWQKWNAFCPEPMQLDNRWPEFVNECILVNELTAVNTVRWEFAEGTRGASTGFTGTVGFMLLPKTKVDERQQPYWDGADVVMQSLARFAFYCGIGHHATLGMGQTRVVSSSIKETHPRSSDRVQIRKRSRHGSS